MELPYQEVSQADDEGSIPFTRSIFISLHSMHWDLLRPAEQRHIPLQLETS